MSQPISYCMMSQAANGDQKAFDFLVRAMDYNRSCGAYTQLGCHHTPVCPGTPELLEASWQRINKAVDDLRAERARKNPNKGKLGNFDKWIFPVIKNGTL